MVAEPSRGTAVRLSTVMAHSNRGQGGTVRRSSGVAPPKKERTAGMGLGGHAPAWALLMLALLTCDGVLGANGQGSYALAQGGSGTHSSVRPHTDTGGPKHDPTARGSSASPERERFSPDILDPVAEKPKATDLWAICVTKCADCPNSSCLTTCVETSSTVTSCVVDRITLIDSTCAATCMGCDNHSDWVKACVDWVVVVTACGMEDPYIPAIGQEGVASLSTLIMSTCIVLCGGCGATSDCIPTCVQVLASFKCVSPPPPILPSFPPPSLPSSPPPPSPSLPSSPPPPSPSSPPLIVTDAPPPLPSSPPSTMTYATPTLPSSTPPAPDKVELSPTEAPSPSDAAPLSPLSTYPPSFATPPLPSQVPPPTIATPPLPPPAPSSSIDAAPPSHSIKPTPTHTALLSSQESSQVHATSQLPSASLPLNSTDQELPPPSPSPLPRSIAPIYSINNTISCALATSRSITNVMNFALTTTRSIASIVSLGTDLSSAFWSLWKRDTFAR